MMRYLRTARHLEQIVVALLLAGIGLLVLMLVDLVPPLGHHPGLGSYVLGNDVATDYRIGFFWAVLVGVSLLVWPIRTPDKHALLVIWLVKMVVVLGIMVFIESNARGLDSFYYFGQPQREGSRWPGFTFGDGTANIVGLSWLHQQLIPASYYAMKVSFAMVGLIAVYVMYRAAARFLGREDIRVLYLLALFPGILFWSSILGKDPVILLGISLYIYGVVGVYRHPTPDLKRLVYLIGLVGGIVLASFIRIWLAPILVAPLLVFVLFSVRNVIVRVLLISIVGGAFVHAIEVTNHNFNVESSEDLVETADHVSHGWDKGSQYEGGSSMSVTRFRDLGSLAKFAPIGAFTALFRPLPGEVLNPLGLLAGLENLVLLGLLLRAIKRTKWRELRHPLLLWASTLIVVWSLVYGFASSQNLGTAVRWKLQVLPLMVGLLCFLGRRRSELVEIPR
jgi:hypothetical protein